MQGQLQAWVRLNSVEGMGIPKKLELLRLFGNPEDLFQIDKSETIRVGLKTEQAEMLMDPSKNPISYKIVENAQKKGIRIIPLDHDEYPEMLKYIHDPPLVLFVKGIIPKSLCIAVVGSRKASGYGLEVAFKLSSELAMEGCVVVSGMARGIDTVAHTGALHAGGQTIAVLGCGPDSAYPPENKGLMERISENGAVLSEYPPGIGPIDFHFPVRNRIISGISMGVLVVEAGEKSGSLITAQTALDQGREVFSVPGNINHFNSMGTNKLIKEGAKLVLSVEDILEELPWQLSSIKLNKSEKRENAERLSIDENRVYQILKIEDLYDEQIARKTSIPLKNLYKTLLDLELKGLIRKDLTGLYGIFPN